MARKRTAHSRGASSSRLRLAKGLNRIDAGTASAGEIACDDRDGGEQERHRRERCWVGRADVEEQAGEWRDAYPRRDFRQAAGDIPVSRLNARLNAASES
jgi:hypothetical protein